MSSSIEEPVEVYESLQKTGFVRLALTLVLVVMLGISGLLTVTFAGQTRADTNNSIAGYENMVRVAAQLSPTPVPTRRTTPTLTPLPSIPPGGQLPPILSQAIAALQAQNRLLYKGNATLPEIALTFDDGPNPYYTPQILAILHQYNVKATFFDVGRLVAAFPQIVKQEYAAGNIIGDHSWSHPDLALLPQAYIQAQLTDTSDAIQAAIGVRPTFFRPPYGVMSVPVLTEAYHLGFTTVIWNDEAQDWARPGVSIIIERIFRLASDGAIILMHDGGGDRSQTVAALPYIITGLRQSGFQLVTLPQLMQDLHRQKSGPAPGYRVPNPTSPAPTPGPGEDMVYPLAETLER